MIKGTTGREEVRTPTAAGTDSSVYVCQYEGKIEIQELCQVFLAILAPQINITASTEVCITRKMSVIIPKMESKQHIRVFPGLVCSVDRFSRKTDTMITLQTNLMVSSSHLLVIKTW